MLVFCDNDGIDLQALSNLDAQKQQTAVLPKS